MPRHHGSVEALAMTRWKKTVAVGLLSAGLAAGLCVTTNIAVANADGCSNDPLTPPCHWCPGQPLPMTGNHVTNPVRWDQSVCHTYWFVRFGQGNAAQNIFEGDAQPPPPPPALIDRSNCQQLLGMFCPHA